MAKTKKKDSEIGKKKDNEIRSGGAKTSSKNSRKGQSARPRGNGKAPTGQKQRYFSTEAWISLPTAAIVITILSLGMAVLTAWQAIPIKGIVEGIFWGLVFGGSIWVIFIGAFWLNRFLRR